MRWTIVPLALALLTAGCIGSGDDAAVGPDSTETGNATADGNATVQGNSTVDDNRTREAGNATSSGNATADGNATGAAGGSAAVRGNGTTTTWRYDNRSGTVSGAGLLVESPSSEETLEVPTGTVTLVANLSANGELDVALVPPDCEDDACEITSSTTDGAATVSVDDPTPGTWTVRLTATGLGPQSVEYDLGIGLEVR